MKPIIPVERIEQRILLIRGQKVMLDSHLAELYGVETGGLNRAVSRNTERFPADFMFRLTQREYRNLRCQFGILSWGGHSKYRPRVFTEQGVAMLSSVLRSQRAVQVNIEIIRTFVRLRRLLASHKDLAQRLDALERKCDGRFRQVFDAIRELMDGPEAPSKRIGFRTEGPCR